MVDSTDIRGSRQSADLRSVALGPLTPDERRAFADEQIADYAEYLVERGRAPDPKTALAGARAEIEPEVAAAVQAGNLFWTARDPNGVTVGWLWVKPTLPDLPPPFCTSSRSGPGSDAVATAWPCWPPWSAHSPRPAIASCA